MKPCGHLNLCVKKAAQLAASSRLISAASTMGEREGYLFSKISMVSWDGWR